MGNLDLISIIVYFGLLALIIIKSRQKKQTAIDFALDGQRTPGILVFATLTASFLGPGYTMGLSEQGYQSGFLFFFVYLGFSLQSLLVGRYIAPKLRDYDQAQTVGDIMGYHYGKLARLFTGLLSLMFCIGIIGLISFITGSVFYSILDIPRAWGSIIGTTIVVFYSVFGGMRTVVYTDILQFIFLTISLPVLLISIYYNTPDTASILQDLPDEVLHPFRYVGVGEFIGLFIGFVFGETLIPPSANRAFLAKTSKDARNGFVFSGLYSIIWFGMCAVVGIFAQYALPGIVPDTSFMSMAKLFLPVGFLGLLLAAVVSIIMSTQDSYLNASSVVFVRDIVGYFNPNLTDRQYLLYSRAATFIIGSMGIVFALQLTGILDGIMINYTLWGPTIVLPLVFAVTLKHKVKPIAGLMGVLFGLMGVILWEWVLYKPYDIPSLVAGITLNLSAFWIFHIFGTKNSNWSILKSSSGMKNLTN